MIPQAATPRRALPRSIAALVAVGLALVASGAVLAWVDRSPSAPAWKLATGQPVPRVVLPDLRDPSGRIALAGSRGLPVVVNVFSSTCAPCVEELPAVEAFSREAAGRVQVIGVDHLDRRAAGLALVKRTGVTFPVAFDEMGRLATDYRLAGLPATFFLHGDGTLADAVLGPIDAGELRAKAERLRRAT